MKWRVWAGVLLFVVALGCAVYGFAGGEGQRVMQKAVLICLECIGIG